MHVPTSGLTEDQVLKPFLLPICRKIAVPHSKQLFLTIDLDMDRRGVARTHDSRLVLQPGHPKAVPRAVACRTSALVKVVKVMNVVHGPTMDHHIRTTIYEDLRVFPVYQKQVFGIQNQFWKVGGEQASKF